MAERSLHIAMVVPPWYDVPPVGYGGIEQLVADLTQHLIARGNRVTLIGGGRNGTDADHLPTYPQAQPDRLGEVLPEVVHAAIASKLIDGLEVDVVHDNSLAGPLTAAARAVPTVVTVHSPAHGEPGDYYAALGPSVALVAISEAQRALRPDLNWVATVHNAIDVASFPYRRDKDDYVLFLGRMNPDKGVHLAIEAARAAGQRLVIAAKCSEHLERRYFEHEVRPRLAAGINYSGPANAAEKRALLRSARCLLLPLCWEEPFGLVMVEALACGTPVVVLRRGSAAEVVTSGVTGIVCDRPEELPAALDEVRSIDPAACRRDAEQRFDVSLMAERYEQVYRKLA